MKTFLKFWRLGRNLLAQLAIISLLSEQFIFVFSSTAQAAELPITPDGTTNTQIDHAANGVPIVNIASPNAGGLSHNKFENYNVSPSGLILNNAIGSQNGVIQTQIGGLINDNANLATSGAASVILNEVTSNNISQINGYTEIAGKKADLVLANPNGFVFNGSGFINVSKFTAVVGSSNQFNPNPNDLTFRLSDNAYAVTHGFLPKLTIMGAGIDLENITSTDLVANVMNIVAPVYAGTNDVNLRTGDASFNYLTKAVTSDNTTPGSNLPDEVAIDASALGKIQAGRIFIVATKEGFGIKYSGDLLASRAGITIDNQGNIDYNNIASEVGNISVTSQKGSIIQRGISQTKNASNDITLNAFSDITNYGQFVSTRNINIDSGATFRNESTALNLSDSDFTIDAVDFTNLGQIAANRDLRITATTSLSNSSKLVAGRELTLSSAQITNDDSIFAGNKINITASNYLTNNKDIVSLGLGLTDETAEDGILISAKTLNNNKQIAAKNNITINSNSLNNNTANSKIIALNNINLNAISVDNSNANIKAANNLVLRNLTLNAPTVASNFGVTSQATSLTNTSGTFYAGSLLDFDLGNLADYTIIGNLKSSGNLKIKATNVTNQTNLQADGAIEIEATDKFINGVLSGDNSNTKITSGDYLRITSNNLLSNYATLSSGTDLSLTSRYGNINNNVNAEIIAGKRYQVELEDGSKVWVNTGALSLSAKNGTVNQNSLNSIVVNGDYSLDVTDFVNTGRVDVAGNLTLNVSNNLVNEAYAMIFSGGNMNLNVAGSLINNYRSVIYSEGDLTIQKYGEFNSDGSANPLYNPLSNRITSLTNYGNIETYLGKNITIKAENFLNSRTVDPVSGLIGTNTNCVLTGGGGIDCGASTAYRKAANHDLYSWTYTGGNNWGEFGRTNYYTTTQGTANSASRAATISSGGTLNIDSGTFSNYISEIYSKGNMTISANNTDNFNKSFTYGRTVTLTEVYDGIGGWPSWCGGGSPCRNNSYSFSNYATSNAYIKSGGSLTVTRNGSTTTSWTNGSEMDDYAAVGGGDGRDLNLVNNIDVNVLGTTGTVNTDISGYFNGPDNNGLFNRNPNPNGPLFETRSQFIDQSKFFGSDYFYQRIGLDLTDVQTQFELQNKRLVGDQFFQTKIIEEQLRTISKNSFLLSANETNINNEIKNLLDNAADEYARLGLNTNTTLTQSQINSLQKDIIWFETKTIDGNLYIVPTIYLAQATKDALKNGNIASQATIFGKDSVTITSNGGISNSGSIVGGNVTLTASNDIINKNFSDITALNNLSLTSSAGSITNFSQLKATGALSMSAAKDITNTSTVLTNAKNLLDSGNVGYLQSNGGASNTGNLKSTIFETAGISGGSITINAGNDFTNQAANITATKNTLADSSITSGNLSITAGDDITIGTLELRNRTEEYWGHKSNGGSKITDTTTNVGSEIASAGSLTLTTTGLGTNNEKATVDAKYTTAQTEYNSNLVVYNQAVADYPTKLAAYNDALAAYNAAKSAGGFKARIAKEPTAPEVPIAPTAPVYSQIMASVDNGGSDIKIVGSNISTTSSGANITLDANDSVNIASAVDSSYKMETSNKKGTIVQKSSININSSTTNVASNITSMGDVAITSGLDTNIIASNLSGSGSGSIISGGDTNIFNATDISYSYSESTKTRTGLLRQLPIYGEMISVLSTVYSPYLSLANGLTGGNLGKIQQAGGIDYNKSSLGNSSTTEKLVASNLSFGNNLTIGSNVDITVKASNLTTASGDILLAANGDVNILSAAETSTTNRNYRDKSDRAKERGNTDNTEIKNISSTVTSGSDLSIISGNNTTIQSSKLSSGDDLTIDAGNNLLLLTAKDTAIKNEENKGRTAYAFSNGTSGYVDVKAVNNEITSNTNSTVNSNLSLNAANSILAQYRAGTMEDVISGANTSNQQLAYLKTVNNLAQADPSKVTLDPIADMMKDWDQTTRGLTGAGQAVIVVAAVAIAIGTGGIGSGISGAMMTAVATTAGTTATISATNASMNTDSSVWGSTKSISSDTWRNTTSDESLRNMAIAAAVAGAGYGVGEWIKDTKINYNNSITPEQAALGKESVSTGHSNLMVGSTENSRVGVNVVQRTNLQTGEVAWFQEGTNIKVSQNFTYTAGNQNPAFQGFNTTPGAPSFADFHDALNLSSPWNELSIPPAYTTSQFNALAPYYPIFIKYETNKK